MTIDTERLRELAGKSRPMAVRLRLGRAYAKADALLVTMTAGKLTSQLPARPAGSPMKDRDSDLINADQFLDRRDRSLRPIF